jgi:hypothetical protein
MPYGALGGLNPSDANAAYNILPTGNWVRRRTDKSLADAEILDRCPNDKSFSLNAQGSTTER